MHQARKGVSVDRKYPKKPFQGDLKEKAYLVGLGYGRFTCTRAQSTNRGKTSTTHLALSKLLCELFNSYGRVYEFSRKNRSYQDEELGYHSRICGNRRLVIGRKNEAARLLRLLPLKHLEKLRMRELFLTTLNIKYWDQNERESRNLKADIREEVKEYTEKARREWMRRHEIPA
jgi:hypothetical protein